MSAAIRLGIDFDNTLVCYDRVFHAAAAANGLIPHDLAVNKTMIRDYIRSHAGPEAWTKLQGAVYGKQIESASPFEGVRESLEHCKAKGASLALISHKTKWPVAGPKWNLQAAAWAWLEAQNFYSERSSENLFDEVWFEETREGKYQRIRDWECDLFLDDLPEFLADEEFPKCCRPVLFDPLQMHAEIAPTLKRISSWRELPELIDSWDAGS